VLESGIDASMLDGEYLPDDLNVAQDDWHDIDDTGSNDEPVHPVDRARMNAIAE
jgi:hypothetical protein